MIMTTYVSSRLIAAMAVLAAAVPASARDLAETVHESCDVPLSKMKSCAEVCDNAVRLRRFQELDVETQEMCRFAFAVNAVRRSRSKPCDEHACLYNLRPQKFTKAGRRETDSYSGNGYRVSLDYSYRDAGWTIRAAITDRGGQLSTFSKECAGDGSCDDWQHRSGPMRRAAIWIPFQNDPKKSIAISIPK
jgi:hypothetical protein